MGWGSRSVWSRSIHYLEVCGACSNVRVVIPLLKIHVPVRVWRTLKPCRAAAATIWSIRLLIQSYPIPLFLSRKY